MEPSDPKAGEGTSAGDTQIIDLREIELVAAEVERRQSLPPPLPPAEPAPPAVAAASPRVAAAMPARSTSFYLAAVLVVVALGTGGGVFLALRSTGKKAAAVPQAKVITIATVDMGNEADAGPDGGD
jgi:hypothetical protein